MRAGTVIDVSLCVEISVMVVDQFPYLWDHVLTGETGKKSMLVRQQRLLPPHAHTPSVVLQMEVKEASDMQNRFCIFIFPPSFFQSPNP